MKRTTAQYLINTRILLPLPSGQSNEARSLFPFAVYPQFGGSSVRPACWDAMQRLRERGSNISARTKLVLLYVKEGAPAPRTVTQRKAIRGAKWLWKRFPVMCRNMRIMHMVDKQAQASNVINDMYPAPGYPAGGVIVHPPSPLEEHTEAFRNTLDPDADYFRPEELGY